MDWINNNDKLSALDYYEKMGFKCSFITGNSDNKDSYKKPSETETTVNYLEKCTGLGVYLGGNNEFRAIDIDDFQIQVIENSDSVHWKLSKYAENFFIKKCMSLLGLPEDYEWLIRTPHGWHIIISAPSFGFDKVAYMAKKDMKPQVISGNVVHFRNIELLWESFLVMPPSNYGEYQRYSFFNQIPKSTPIRIGSAQILEFLCYFCGEFEYITHLTNCNNVPIIGNAHLFPHYNLHLFAGSQYYEYNALIENLSRNNAFLKTCRNSLGYNMHGYNLVYNDLVDHFKVQKGLDAAIKCFRMANDGWGHYNLACLMAIGAMDGSLEQLYNHLKLSKEIPDEYKDQLKLLYLAKNDSYEIYGIIDICTNDNQRVEKIAILLVDVMGNVLDKSFLSNDSVMLPNMYYTLERADYIVGCDLSTIVRILQKECELSDKVVHGGSNCMDAFERPWINLPSLEISEEDPFRRVYKIKETLGAGIKRLDIF